MRKHGNPTDLNIRVAAIFHVGPAGPLAIILDIAWFMMVNGQSLMLYSRLHLGE